MIRPATEADVSRAVAMGLRFIGSSLYQRVVVPDVAQIEAVVRSVIEHGAAFVAEDAGQIVGMIGGLVRITEADGQPFLAELAWWVEPRARGLRRIGPALLDALEHWALERGITQVQMVAPAGTKVGAFYIKCGYTPVETHYAKRVA